MHRIQIYKIQFVVVVIDVIDIHIQTYTEIFTYTYIPIENSELKNGKLRKSLLKVQVYIWVCVCVYVYLCLSMSASSLKDVVAVAVWKGRNTTNTVTYSRMPKWKFVLPNDKRTELEAWRQNITSMTSLLAFIHSFAKSHIHLVRVCVSVCVWVRASVF